MTTEVIVKANHGWPVRVTAVSTRPDGPVGSPVIVPAMTQQSFHVHSGQDLLIHEIQPAEDAS